MGTTPGGLPWPAGSDQLFNGDDAIKALADALDARGGGLLVQAGQTNVTYVGGNCVITFPKPFKTGTVPGVVAQPQYNAGQLVEMVAATIRSPTATQFQSTAYQVSGTPGWFAGLASVSWIAVGVAP